MSHSLWKLIQKLFDLRKFKETSMCLPENEQKRERNSGGKYVTFVKKLVKLFPPDLKHALNINS